MEVTVLPDDDPKKLRIGWKIIELPPLVLINDNVILTINIDTLPEIDDHIFSDIKKRFELLDFD